MCINLILSFFSLSLVIDENDFIVDDDGQPISQTKKKRHKFHDDA